jgi:hypothetical protein
MNNNQKFINENFKRWVNETDKYAHIDEIVAEYDLLEESSVEKLHEIQIPGLSFVVRSWRWLVPLMNVVANHPKTPKSLRKLAREPARTANEMESKLDKFAKDYPTIWNSVQGVLGVSDILGTIKGEALRSILIKVQDSLYQDQPEYNPKLAAQDKQNRKPDAKKPGRVSKDIDRELSKIKNLEKKPMPTPKGADTSKPPPAPPGREDDEAFLPRTPFEPKPPRRARPRSIADRLMAAIEKKEKEKKEKEKRAQQIRQAQRMRDAQRAASTRTMRDLGDDFNESKK